MTTLLLSSLSHSDTSDCHSSISTLDDEASRPNLKALSGLSLSDILWKNVLQVAVSILDVGDEAPRPDEGDTSLLGFGLILEML
jgi:hypothetical protein